MLQGLLFILLLMVLFVAIAAMIVVRFFYNTVNRLRDAARKAMGYDSPGTGSDYTGRSSRQYSYRGGSSRTASSSSGPRSSAGGSAGSGSRRSQTASGTTIIDGRAPERASRKIFAEGDGEYVDFEEEK